MEDSPFIFYSIHLNIRHNAQFEDRHLLTFRDELQEPIVQLIFTPLLHVNSPNFSQQGSPADDSSLKIQIDWFKIYITVLQIRGHI